MNKKVLYALIGVAIVAAAAGGYTWWSRRQAQQSDAELRAAVVQRGDMVVAVTASGTIEPARRVNLVFQTSGRVNEVPVEIGDHVEKGDLLASLESEQLELQVEQAEANLASAQAQLARLQAGAGAQEVAASEANVRAADAQVDAAAADRDQVASGAEEADVAAAEADLASAITQQKKAEDWHDTTLECFTFEASAGDVIPIGGGEVITLTEDIKRDFCPLLGVPEEQARYRLQAANEALEAARASLDQTKSGADQNQLAAAQANVAAAAARRDAAQAQLDLVREGATKEQIAAAQAAVDQAQASVNQAQLALEQAVLEAPFDGIVGSVDVSVGQQAAAGLPVLTLVDASMFHVTISADELEVGRLSRGQVARLSFDALPDTVVTGTVEHVAEAATLEGGVVTYDVHIDLAPSEAPIRSDMTTSASVIVEEISDALRVPTWAVHIDRDTGQYYVRRRTAQGIERVDVKLGERHEGMAQVLEGLSEGDEIVRAPESSLFDFESGFGG